MQAACYIGGIVIAYLLGSVPSAVWIGKVFHKTDVREHGSRNAGATNAFRVLGPKAGILVLLADVSKGVLAVLAAFLIPSPESGPHQDPVIGELMGLSAVAGHIFPVFANFRGGKGVSTMLGISLVLVPLPVGACLAVFICTLLLTRYVSLGSLLAGCSFPFAVWLLSRPPHHSLIIFSAALSLILVITHRHNILRLLSSGERRIRWTR